VWEIRSADNPLDGKLLSWGDRVQLVHVGSDQVLMVKLPEGTAMAPPTTALPRRGSVLPKADIAAALALTPRDAKGTVLLTSNHQNPDTYFELHQQYKLTGHIKYSQFFHIRHVETGAPPAPAQPLPPPRTRHHHHRPPLTLRPPRRVLAALRGPRRRCRDE